MHDEAGISYYWRLNHVNLNNIKSILSQINYDTYLQNWSTQIQNNPLCVNYRMYKTEFGLETYLTLLPYDLRIAFAKFRCGAHYLPISNARYLEIDDRNLCSLCFEDTGDEFHYLFNCPAFSLKRSELIKPFYYNRPNREKYRLLMENRNKKMLIDLSKFVKYIMYVFRL